MLVGFGFLLVKRWLKGILTLLAVYSHFFASQKQPNQLYSQRKNDVVDGFGMTGSDQLLFKRRVVDSINLALICPYKELVTLTSARQGSDTTLNLNLPVKRKQTFGLTLTSRYLFSSFPLPLTL